MPRGHAARILKSKTERAGDAWLRIQEDGRANLGIACNYLGISLLRLKHAVESKEIQAFQFGKRVYIMQEELVRYRKVLYPAPTLSTPTPSTQGIQHGTT